MTGLTRNCQKTIDNPWLSVEPWQSRVRKGARVVWLIYSRFNYTLFSNLPGVSSVRIMHLRNIVC